MDWNSLDERNLYEKSRSKALEILLKCEKCTEGINKFLPKRFIKDITDDQKSILLNAMKLFDIKNTIVSLFRNGFIKSLDYQSTLKLEQKSKPEESVEERTTLRKQRFDEIAKNEKEINLELFRKYFKYSSPVHVYKNLNELINTDANKVQANSIKSALTDFKKDTENRPKDIANKIEENSKIIDIVEHILYFNEKNQKGQGLKILTPDQMPSRLPISLAAQLNARIIQKNLKIK